MMRKKAMAISWLVAAVLMLAAIVMLWWIPQSIGKAAESGSERAACQQSLDYTQKIRMIGGTLADASGNAASLKCATDYIETSAEGDALLGEISNYLYDCWSLYGKREGLFDTSGASYCIVCKSIKPLSAKGYSGLLDYLRAKKAPTSRGGTYLENLGGEGALASGAQGYDSFTFSGDAAIVVTYGTQGFKGNHLVFDAMSKTGIIISDYSRIGALGCYTFEGKSRSLEYSR